MVVRIITHFYCVLKVDFVKSAKSFKIQSVKMKPIKAVIFDLGRVLVDVNVQRFRAFFPEETDMDDLQQALSRIMAAPVMAQFNTGCLRPQVFYQRLCEDCNLHLSFDEFVFRWCDIFEPIGEMEGVVEALSQKVKLGLLSNTDQLHWEYIQSHYPLMRYFPRPTLSFEVGVMKPHPAIYVQAAKNVETALTECLFIDDLTEYVDGAAAAGMKAIQFEGAGQLVRELKQSGLL
jgi:glucose-1-phosphatase